jgi:hypothetical protein
MDEYGDMPGQGGTQLATMDTVLPDADVHTKGTIRKGSYGDIVFWMSTPRPKELTIEEWDAYRQKRWEKAFS